MVYIVCAAQVLEAWGLASSPRTRRYSQSITVSISIGISVNVCICIRISLFERINARPDRLLLSSSLLQTLLSLPTYEDISNDDPRELEMDFDFSDGDRPPQVRSGTRCSVSIS